MINRASSRTIEMMHTLNARMSTMRYWRADVADTDTYTPPKQKTPASSHFCLVGSFNRLTTGIGRIMIIRSVTIFIAAFENHEASSLIHFPSVAGTQNFLTGVQTKIHAATVAIVYETITAMKLQHHIWKRRVVNTR